MSDYNEILAERAKELYDTCDIESKGFITKKEMERLVALLPLSQEQLEAVFDSLDDDGNGKLTLQEFTDGFGQYIIGDVAPSKKRDSSVFTDGDFEMQDNKFQQSLEGFSQNSFERETASDLYDKLKAQNPDVLPGFENMLSKMVHELDKRKKKVQKIESTIAQETSKHEEKVQTVYNEIEKQIKTEEQKILLEVKQKEKQIREEMEQDLREKDKHYQDLLAKHNDTKTRLAELSQLTGKTQQEIEQLADEKEMLEEALEETELNLEENQFILEDLRSKVNEDRRQRAANVTTVTKGISSEREQLLAQLSTLREINKKLKDERDEGLMMSEDVSRSGSPQGEVLNFADKPPIHNYDSDDNEITPSAQDNGNISLDSELNSINKDIRKIKLSEASQIFGDSMNVYEFDNKFGEALDDVDDGIEIDEEPAMVLMTPLESRPLYRAASINTKIDKPKPIIAMKEVNIQTEPIEDEVKKPPPETPKTIAINYKLIFSGEEIPESVFKVVIVGDTNVGKTALLDRFCTSEFHNNYNHTVGIDFQLRCLMIEQHPIALQIWDTAGQERFEAISKQFYRKADGVILVYDIMEKGSFTNICNWINKVEQNTTDEVMLMVLGNKLDLASDNVEMAIPTKQADDLSRKYGALFFEVSALNGTNVNESFATLASILKARQDQDMNDAIKLELKTTKSKSCCCKTSNSTEYRITKRNAIVDSKRKKKETKPIETEEDQSSSEIKTGQQ